MDKRDVLEWEIKASLLAYVQGLGDGVVAWHPDQQPGEFPLLPGNESSVRRLCFAGGVSLRGHGGMLHVVIEAPCIDLEHGMLLARVRQAEEPVAILHLGDADIQQCDGGFVITYAAPSLTPDGAIVFGGFYREGERFSPIVLRLEHGTAIRLAGIDAGSGR